MLPYVCREQMVSMQSQWRQVNLSGCPAWMRDERGAHKMTEQGRIPDAILQFKLLKLNFKLQAV